MGVAQRHFVIWLKEDNSHFEQIMLDADIFCFQYLAEHSEFIVADLLKITRFNSQGQCLGRIFDCPKEKFALWNIGIRCSEIPVLRPGGRFHHISTADFSPLYRHATEWPSFLSRQPLTTGLCMYPAPVPVCSSKSAYHKTGRRSAIRFVIAITVYLNSGVGKVLLAPVGEDAHDHAFSMRSATFNEASIAAPEDMPQNMPSSFTMRRTMSNASSESIMMDISMRDGIVYLRHDGLAHVLQPLYVMPAHRVRLHDLNRPGSAPSGVWPCPSACPRCPSADTKCVMRPTRVSYHLLCRRRIMRHLIVPGW